MANESSASKFNVVTVVLLAGLLALLGLQLYTSSGLSSAEDRIEALQQQQQTEREQLDAEIARLKMEAERTSQQQQEHEEMLAAVEGRTGQTERGVRGLRQDVEEKDAAIEADVRTIQGQTEQRLKSSAEALAQRIDEVRQSATQAQSGVEAVSGEVSQLRSTAATKAELEAAVADLNRVTGDLGIVSDRIATNAEQLDALKLWAERDYLDFQIFKLDSPIQMDGVAITLTRADPSNQRYSLKLDIAGHTIEKRDREINEPLQFFLGESRVPYELVVNTVGPNQITGYLARPLSPAEE